MQPYSQAYASNARSPSVVARQGNEGEIKLIGVARDFDRNQEIFGECESADFVYKVVSGAVRGFRVLADGRRQITDFYLPGDVFGVEFGPARRYAAEAVTDATVVMARRSTVSSEPDQGAPLWRHALGELQRSQDHVLTLGRRSAAERVASFLVDLADRVNGDDEVDLPMPRQDMADYLGLTIETVSRTLTQLQAQGLIDVSGCRHVRLRRPSALVELCD